MPSPSKKHAQAAGFTLVEVLLALGILVLIASVMILSVTSLRRSTNSREGAIRMETALRLARADAANTGRRLRMTFDKDTGVLSVTWEADPINKPGQFTQYTAASWPGQLPADLVTVKRCVRTGTDSAADASASSDGSTATSSENDTAQSPSNQNPDEDPQRQSLTFYPDGSSDSALIELSSDADPSGSDPTADAAVIELDGFSGNVTSRILSSRELQERRTPSDAPDTQSRG